MHFQKYTVTKHKVTITINESTIHELTVNKLMVYESTVNDLTINKPTVPEKHLLFMDGHSCHYSLESFQLVRDYSINLICPSPHTSHIVQTQNMETFESVTNWYY